ncbi:MAG: hypothetical protein O7C59_10245, partial [Rickettsia endosymbiont of Ixodes persulcatus]|nr:hypothetical protein [Rickettsia endosymbiont of Ixodes persulcatus]
MEKFPSIFSSNSFFYLLCYLSLPFLLSLIPLAGVKYYAKNQAEFVGNRNMSFAILVLRFFLIGVLTVLYMVPIFALFTSVFGDAFLSFIPYRQYFSAVVIPLLIVIVSSVVLYAQLLLSNRRLYLFIAPILLVALLISYNYSFSYSSSNQLIEN